MSAASLSGLEVVPTRTRLGLCRRRLGPAPPPVKKGRCYRGLLASLGTPYSDVEQASAPHNLSNWATSWSRWPRHLDPGCLPRSNSLQGLEWPEKKAKWLHDTCGPFWALTLAPGGQQRHTLQGLALLDLTRPTRLPAWPSWLHCVPTVP